MLLVHQLTRSSKSPLSCVRSISSLISESWKEESDTRVKTKEHTLTKGFLRFAEELSEFDRKNQLLNMPVTSTEIRKKLKAFDFKEPMESRELLDNVMNMMQDWTLHSTNPRYFGLFNPTTPVSTVLADAAVAYFNPQLAVWSHAPGAVELEQHTLNFIGRRLGLDPKRSFSTYTSGGSESNMTALLMAIADKAPKHIHEKGLQSLRSPLTVYTSKTVHHSFHKIVKNIGLGIDHMRQIPVDEHNRMDMDALVTQLELDKHDGFVPVAVVGTSGTTSMGIIDPLEDIANICDDFGLWFHVDGAWGGSVVLSDTFRGVLKGIERADSVTIDAHKMLSVPFGAGMLFTNRSRDLAEEVFGCSADYVPIGNLENNDTVNYYTSTIQWTRRFMGLKLFMVLAEFGEKGISDRIDRMFEVGDYMKEQLSCNGWRLHNEIQLPIACVTNDAIEEETLTTSEILEEIYNRSEFWISDIEMMNGQKALRICITYYESTEKDVDYMIEKLTEVINDLVDQKH